MERLLVLVILTVIAVGISLMLQRRRPEAPTAPSYRAPGQVDRADFVSEGADRLVVVFTSATCEGCITVWKVVSSMGSTDIAASANIAVQKVEIEETPNLHRRYKIDGVPTTLVIDRDGVVQKSYFGPIPAEVLLLDLAQDGDR